MGPAAAGPPALGGCCSAPLRRKLWAGAAPVSWTRAPQLPHPPLPPPPTLPSCPHLIAHSAALLKKLPEPGDDVKTLWLPVGEPCFACPAAGTPPPASW